MKSFRNSREQEEIYQAYEGDKNMFNETYKLSNGI